MSFQSVKAGITPLIIANVTAGGPVTVRDRNQEPNLIPPLTQMPLVLLRARPTKEIPLAIGAADRDWYLEMMLWAVFPIDQDQATFDTMCEQLAQTARLHTLVGGNANDPTFGTQVYVSGRELELGPDATAIATGSGQVIRHWRCAPLIREAVFFTGVA